MNHDNVNDGPTPNRPLRQGPPPPTVPDLSCLPDNEREQLMEIIASVLASKLAGSDTLFDLAMDNFVSLGAHKVGHGLNAMLFSSYQALLLRSGQRPRDTPEAMVNLVNLAEEQTEADVAAVEMTTEFVRATMGGAHQAAIGVWAQWVDAIGEDWDLYCKGISMVLAQALYFLDATVEEDEAASEMMGAPLARIVPRDKED